MSENYKKIMESMLWKARNDYLKTPEYEFWNEKRLKIEEDCETMLPPSELKFVNNCFDKLVEINAANSDFIYYRAFKDCIGLLKDFGIL